MKSKGELSKRVVTGVVGGLALLAAVIFGGPIGVRVLAWLLAGAMLYEFVGIAFQLADRRGKTWLLVLLVTLLMVLDAAQLLPVYEGLILSFLSLFLFFLFTAKRHKGVAFLHHTQELMFSVFGVVYLGFLPLYLAWLRELDNGGHWTILFLLMVWMGDTGGYFAGKGFGKHKLLPGISPKKTWEGYFGGLALSLLVAAVYHQTMFPEMVRWKVLCLAVLINAIAQLGDLCESMIKRAFDKKDSGTIIPGHGGFLDRFDGVVFALPVMYICVSRFF